MADIFLNTNTVLGATYDQYGNAMGDYNPVFPYKSSFRLRWQLYTATPGADSDGVDMSSWTKANYSGCGALVTCDNDFVHRISGTLATGITSGSTISSITVNIGSNRDLVPASGFVTIFNNAGGVKDFAYTAVEFSGSNAELTIGEWTADADYSSGAAARVSQEAYFQSYYNASLSNPATGLFVFDCVVYSRKVSAAGDAASGQWIDVQGIEILPYKLADNVYTELPSFLCRTAAISVNMGEAGMNPVVTTPVENMILAFVSSLFSAGADVELYNSSTEQWVPYDEVSEFTRAYTKYRWWLNGGDGAVKTEMPIINGIDGNDGDTPYIDPETLHWIIGDTDTGISAQGVIVQIQYSADAQNWHDAFTSGDKFIRFSSDSGVSWSAAMKFIGDNAPQVMIQYSANGASWHQVITAEDFFIRFSVDNGTTWGGGGQFRAYPVRYQYGETASATFHDNFVAGSDKFVKFSSDNGATWTNAIKFVGDDGRSFVPDATGTYAERDTYDDEDMGFSFLVTSGTNEGKIYFKTADTSGEWSDGLQFTPNGLSLQYSLDGSSWHTTAATSDKYIRFSVDNGTSWSAACLFMGHSTYTYTAYASDNSGNDFSLTPSSDLDFWNWIYSENPIAAENLTLQTFNTLGDGWRRCQGDPGITYDWLSGASAPSSSTGKNGDWYLDTNTGNVYQKVSGTWTLKMNIIGPVGAGANPKGAWLSVTSYSKNDMVTYQGSTYIAARDNSNVEPGTSSDDWVLYVSKGDTGPAPTIGSNGNWIIDGMDSGLPSRGPNGVTPNIGANGNWWIGSTDTGVKAEISGSYIEFSAVDSSGNYTMQGDATIPAAVLTSAGNLYPVEKRSITVDTVNHTVTFNVAPYLAYDNVQSFSGTWRLYLAAYCPSSDAAYTKIAADALLADKMPLHPARQISFQPAADAGTGGYINFHYNGAKPDTYTSRIGEWDNGELYISADTHIRLVAPNGATLYAQTSTGSWYYFDIEIPPGSIIKYAASGSIPHGYLPCRGAAISRTSFPRLFSLIGTTFGSGDGSTTFNLPDFTSTDEAGVTSIIHY